MNDVIKEPTQVKHSNRTSTEDAEVQCAAMCAAAGCTSTDCAQMSWAQIIGARFVKAPFGNAFCGKVLLDFLVSLEPQDKIEGLLCLRLLTLHDQYMANPEQTNSCIDMNFNRDTTFMYSFNETLYALNRHRRKVEQKVTFEKPIHP